MDLLLGDTVNATVHASLTGEDANPAKVNADLPHKSISLLTTLPCSPKPSLTVS